MKPIRPMKRIPSPETFTTALNSSLEGFFVTLNTLMHSMTKLLKRVSIEKAGSSAF